MAQSQKFVQTIPAGTTVDVMQGRALQEIDRRFGATGANVTVYATQAAADLSMTLGVGTDNPIQASVPNTQAAGVVSTQQDLIGSFRAQGGDLLRMLVTNASATTAQNIAVLVVIG